MMMIRKLERNQGAPSRHLAAINDGTLLASNPQLQGSSIDQLTALLSHLA